MFKNKIFEKEYYKYSFNYYLSYLIDSVRETGSEITQYAYEQHARTAREWAEKDMDKLRSSDWARRRYYYDEKED